MLHECPEIKYPCQTWQFLVRGMDMGYAGAGPACCHTVTL